ncbi:unnamed protein product [Natator depressus]
MNVLCPCRHRTRGLCKQLAICYRKYWITSGCGSQVDLGDKESQLGCAAAAVCLFPEQELAIPCEGMSAQGWEVAAVKRAFEATPLGCDVVISSDSQWTVQGVSMWAPIWEQQEGKEVAYWDYWKIIIDMIWTRTGSTEI